MRQGVLAIVTIVPQNLPALRRALCEFLMAPTRPLSVPAPRLGPPLAWARKRCSTMKQLLVTPFSILSPDNRLPPGR
jgi:hypothetical protein